MKSQVLKASILLVLVSLFLTTMGATAVPTQSDSAWDRIQKNQKIVVGVSMDYPPYEYVNSKFQADGFDIALIDELGKQLGLPMDIQNYAFEGLPGALETGTIDIAISAIAITPEREESYSFSNVYLTDTSAALTLPTSTIIITAPQQLAAYRVGVQRGSVYETYLQQTLVDTGLMQATQLYSFITPDDALNALAANQIDVFVLDQASADIYKESHNLRIAGEGTNPQRYAVMMSQDTPVLVKNINDALLTLQNNGTLGKLAKEYLHYDPSVIPAGCIDGMSYVADVTYDDKNMTAPPLMKPGQTFVKTWRVRNSGTCTWIKGYQLAYAYGNTPEASMGGQPVFITTPVAPGTTTDLSVTLTAPNTPGTYQGFWQMRNEHGTPFGQTLWVGITVVDTSKPTPAPVPAPKIKSFTVTPTSVTLGQCVTASWVVQGNVTNVVLERDGKDLWKGAPASGQYQDCPPNAGKVVYALGAYGPGGQEIKQVTVKVNKVSSTSVPPTPVPVNPLVGTSWNLLTLDNESVSASYGIALSFLSDGTVKGFDGCQDFTAKYQVTGNQISITKYKPATSISNCLPDAKAVSTQYITALTQVTKYQIKGTVLSMTDAKNKQRLQYSSQ